MYDIISRFLIGLITSIAGFFVLKNILKSDEKLFTVKNMLLIILLTLPTVLFYKSEYNITISIITFFCTIGIYKLIFKLSIVQSVISVGILMIIITFSDVIVSLTFSFFITVEQMRSNFLLMMITNILVGSISVVISNIAIMKDKLNKFLTQIDAKRKVSTSIFLILLIIVISTLFYNLSLTFSSKENMINNVLIMTVFLILVWFYIQEQNNFNKLNHEYDALFQYVQNFEDWVEKEQLNRHELKNSLGAIRNTTKDQQVIQRINEILEDNISIEESWIEQLKYLPKGTLKGLLYYKMAVAQRNQVLITTEVSPNATKYFDKLGHDDWKDLGQLLGVYLDNAMEASKSTEKKKVCIEIYPIMEKIQFVISNTFNDSVSIAQINKKGYTTKGSGHGNGLYYAQKIINKNKHFSSKQQLINDYYIQTLMIAPTKNEM